MSKPDNHRNLLLDSIPNEDFGKLSSHLEPVTLALREVICQPGDPIQHAWFPTNSMMSSIVILIDGTAVEAATIGNEGMAGIGLLVGCCESPYRVIQQVAGDALRVPADLFVEVLEENPSVRKLVQRYTFTLLQQAGQNAACNLHHVVEERMCRWLLQTSDRVGDDEFYITQEFLSEMLGVRRQTINITARTLQDAGLISYRRGNVALRDRPGLEDSACECYEIYNHVYERFMGMPIVKGEED